jgi:predicted nucleic acid-binding Zn ribbon protein
MYRTTIRCLNPDCNKEFRPGRSDQLTCSPRCRTALHRLRKRLKTHSVEAMPPHAQAILEDLRPISQRLYYRIIEIARTQGAGVAEQAVYVAYEAADDCIHFLERNN